MTLYISILKAYETNTFLYETKCKLLLSTSRIRCFCWTLGVFVGFCFSSWIQILLIHYQHFLVSLTEAYHISSLPEANDNKCSQYLSISYTRRGVWEAGFQMPTDLACDGDTGVLPHKSPVYGCGVTLWDIFLNERSRVRRVRSMLPFMKERQINNNLLILLKKVTLGDTLELVKLVISVAGWESIVRQTNLTLYTTVHTATRREELDDFWTKDTDCKN